MAIKRGRFGDYLECSDYPECKTRESIPKGIDFDRTEEVVELNEAISEIKAAEQKIIDEAGKCEKCGNSFSIKMGRFGKFLACNGYPECKNIKKIAKKK